MRRDALVLCRGEHRTHGGRHMPHALQDAGFVGACGGEFHGHVEEATGIHDTIRGVHNAALAQVVTVCFPETLLVGTPGDDLTLQPGDGVVIERASQRAGGTDLAGDSIRLLGRSQTGAIRLRQPLGLGGERPRRLPRLRLLTVLGSPPAAGARS